MNKNKKEYKEAILSLSGGMDSSTILLKLLKEGYKVTTLGFFYKDRQKHEIKSAKNLIKYINKLKKFPKINHNIIKIKGLDSLLNSSSTRKTHVSVEGPYEKNMMKSTMVPNRNKIFSSIIQSVALSKNLINDEKKDIIIAMGIHSGDHTIYPDCTPEFRDLDYKTFLAANWDAEKVTYYTPYLENNKYDILKDGYKMCQELGIDFNEYYKRTLTSYKPYPSGNSDYKSASSIERIEAFIKLGLKDPVTYEDETGVVDWEIAENHVLKILKNNKLN